LTTLLVMKAMVASSLDTVTRLFQAQSPLPHKITSAFIS
jgi:hypothetical protein